MKNYIAVSGVIFAVVAVAQASRALMQLPVHVGSHEIPVWASWIAAALAGGLAAWALQTRK